MIRNSPGQLNRLAERKRLPPLSGRRVDSWRGVRKDLLLGPFDIELQNVGNSPLKSQQRRAVTFTDWSASSRSPAWLDMRYLARFSASRELTVEDAYGRGELLFARKCPDPSDEIVAALDAMIKDKDPA